MSQFEFDRIRLNSHSLLDMSAEQRLKERFITVEDTFQFRCKACGKCCKNRADIALTAYDIYRLAGFFDRTPAEITNQYCELAESTSAPFISPYLLMRAGTCPFLRNKKCFVHAVKPGVCRCFPLGRTFWHDNAGAYFNVNSTTCKHPPQEIRVRDWIADFATEEAEKIGQLWNSAITTVFYSMMNDPGFKDATPERREAICRLVFIMLYNAYNIKEPFYPQLVKNIETLREKMAEQLEFNIISIEDYRQVLVDSGSPLSPPNNTRSDPNA